MSVFCVLPLVPAASAYRRLELYNAYFVQQQWLYNTMLPEDKSKVSRNEFPEANRRAVAVSMRRRTYNA